MDTAGRRPNKRGCNQRQPLRGLNRTTSKGLFSDPNKGQDGRHKRLSRLAETGLHRSTSCPPSNQSHPFFFRVCNCLLLPSLKYEDIYFTKTAHHGDNEVLDGQTRRHPEWMPLKTSTEWKPPQIRWQRYLVHTLMTIPVQSSLEVAKTPASSPSRASSARRLALSALCCEEQFVTVGAHRLGRPKLLGNNLPQILARMSLHCRFCLGREHPR